MSYFRDLWSAYSVKALLRAKSVSHVQAEMAEVDLCLFGFFVRDFSLFGVALI